jgi:hypothetical protein
MFELVIHLLVFYFLFFIFTPAPPTLTGGINEHSTLNFNICLRASANHCVR